MKILVGTPVYRQGAYSLDKFLSNQQQIQQRTPSCELALVTCEADYVPELKKMVEQYRLRATVIPYEVIKPDYARSRVWNIACGREAVRKYLLENHEFEGLLYLDADMTYDKSVVDIMMREIEGYDVVFSGYRLRAIGTGLTGAGCLMMSRRILKKIAFRCYEFKNGESITEDNTMEMDLFQVGARIKKGYFLAIDHYINSDEFVHIEPQKVGLYDKTMTSPLFRYCLIKINILLKFNLSTRLFRLMNKLRKNQCRSAT